MGFQKALFLFACILPSLVQAQNPQLEEHISKDGQLEVTLTVDWVTSLDGERIAPGYNGKAMGPTLRVKPGDTVTVHLVNNLEPVSGYDRELYNYLRDPMSDPINATIIANRLSPQGFIWNPAFGYWGLHFMNLHFHGAMFDPKVEDYKSALGGGESKTYVFRIPEDQPPLVAWYHNHYHGNNVYSMLSGLYGFIIIEGTDSDVTKIPGVDDATQVLVMLGESNVDPVTKDPTPIMKIGFNWDWTAVTNGEKGEKLAFTFDKGEKVLFRIASATTQPDKYLSIDNHTMLEIARDGYPLRSFEERTRLDMEAGSRLEFMTTFDTPGTYVMRIKEWNAGHGEVKCTEIFGAHVNGKCISFDKPTIALTVVVLDNENTSVATGRSTAIPKPPEYHPFLNNLAAMPSVRERNVTMSLKKGRPFFQIPSDPSEPDDTRAPDFCHGMNEQFFTPHVIHGEMELGTCETWNVRSDQARVPHPFHVHSTPYLVKQYEGQDVEVPFWRDTYQLNTSMVVHICFPRYTGDIVVHCHMARHQDIGMSAIYRIVPPATESIESDIDMQESEPSDSTSEEPPNDSSSEPSSDSPPSDLPGESSDASIKQHMGSTFSISLISFLIYILF